ncbi:hypothetical protein DFH06DRAFT_1029771 [Mycena polygramma]|nr:hypothetical protein DFH06DRAFT_1029771 [Mycena polygramma]
MSLTMVDGGPPFAAAMGLACHRCFKVQTLSRCSACLRVVYCSLDCQKLDWKAHKHICKVLRASAKNESKRPRPYLSRLPSEPTVALSLVNRIADEDGDYSLELIHETLGRPPTPSEVQLILYEPRCMVCARTENLIRIEAAKSGTTTEKCLTPCPKCNVSFCCSPAHWEAALTLHDAPCEDGPPDVSQCQMNIWLEEDRKLMPIMKEAGMFDASGDLIGVPPTRLKSVWTSLAGLSWDTALDDALHSTLQPSDRVRSIWLRSASESLTRVMTILYALEKMHDSDSWTRKDTLTIHIIGAGNDETRLGRAFEEILHRLPEVNTLRLVFCGPALTKNQGSFHCTTCVFVIPRHAWALTEPYSRQCKELGRKRMQEHAACTYHEYVQKKGSEFEKPDLCIAFNSGASQMPMYNWSPTFRLLVARKIPTLFTSYSREEAEADAALLRAVGATLRSGLGPAKNPWGSLTVRPVASRVYGFHAVNGWLAGGFI